MKLEDEIKQSHFTSPLHKVLLNIKFTSSLFTSQTKLILKPYKISPEQYNVLRILKGQYPKPSTLNLISERMLDKMSNATRLVEKLREKGYVTRNQCPTNRRKVDILITQGGLNLLDELDPVMRDRPEFEGRLSDDEMILLSDLLDKLRG